jgi:Ca2+-transporting ATPase
VRRAGARLIPSHRKVACPDAPWAADSAEVARSLAVDTARGLSAVEAGRRRQRFGSNMLAEHRRRSLLAILIAQFRSIVVLLLVAAMVFSVALGDLVEALAIAVVVALNTAIGFSTEWRATRSMEALRRFARAEATVLREGQPLRVAAAYLVPGDLVLLEAGGLVPADLRISDASKLQVDESALTGESMPVRKQHEPVPRDASLLERPSMAYRGTAVTRGSGAGIVVATGMDTELGRIYAQVSAARPRQTPLEQRLALLGRRLVWIVLAMAIVLVGAGVLAGRELALSIEVAIALSVAAIPEGLPIVATIALARGLWRMAGLNALATRLSAVETLGATSVILTDKTGTLTENRMTVTEMRLADRDIAVGDDSPPPGDVALRLLERAALCCNASLGNDEDDSIHRTGDPTELALLDAAARFGLERSALLAAMPELREEPFDATEKRMATVHEGGRGPLAAVKGAPESLLALCSAELGEDGERPLDAARRQAWLQRAEELAAGGLRTLAIAERHLADATDSPYEALVLLGIVGMEDPAREGVREAIECCRAAGVTVVMVTGDHAATAVALAGDTGIVDAGHEAGAIDGSELARLLAAGDPGPLLSARVFARVTPEQKLRLIELYQDAGHVVAMTGDGVNDAPALKKADIGVAMGVRGTEVAREAASLVLLDDELRTTVVAIEQGRAIFANIRKFVVYLLSCNLSEMLVVVLATLAGAPLPLLPLQILFLNLVTDVFPALALGVGAGAPGSMNKPPRPATERVLMTRHWVLLVLYGILLSLTVLGAMGAAITFLGVGREEAVTVSFLTLALAQLWHVFNLRDDSSRWLRNEISGNPWIWVALPLCLALVGAAVYLPPLANVLSLVPPDAAGWALVVGASLAPLLIAPMLRPVARSFGGRAAEDI